jgi:NTP pyrophosphatase (non-canonical NTP hydrolase)
MALIVEAGELAEHFQWLTQDESFNLPDDKLQDVGEELADIFVYLVRLADQLGIEELADIFVYLVRLADQLGIDLPEAVDRKIALNEAKYPADLVRGSAKKYNEY